MLVCGGWRVGAVEVCILVESVDLVVGFGGALSPTGTSGLLLLELEVSPSSASFLLQIPPFKFAHHLPSASKRLGWGASTMDCWGWLESWFDGVSQFGWNHGLTEDPRNILAC